MTKTQKKTKRTNVPAGIDDTTRHNFECAKEQIAAQPVMDDSDIADG